MPFFGIPVSTAESAARTGAVVAFLAGTLAARKRDWLALAKGWEASGWNGDDFDDEITSTFTDVVRYPLAPLMSGMVGLGRTMLGEEIGLQLPTTEEAQRSADIWAQVYASQVADELGLTNATVIQSMLPDWLSRRLPATVLAQRAKELYGLDPRSAAAITSYGSSEAKRKNLRGLIDRYLENRATIIGHVHTFTALNTGRQMMLAEGMAQGFLKRDARKVWVTALDERVCETCGPMDGVAVPILDEFTVSYPLPRTTRGKVRPNVKLTVPPVHPNCRCTVVLDKKFVSGIITRTARFEDHLPDHRARLLSNVADLIRQ